MSLVSLALFLALSLCAFSLERGMGWDQSGGGCTNCTVCPYPCNQPPPSPSGYPLYGTPPPPAPPSTPSYRAPPPPPVTCPPFPIECCRQPPPSPYSYGIPPPPYPYGMVPEVGGAAACYSSVVSLLVTMLMFLSAAMLF